MQNPQQDPGMERRLLLVFVLTFAVLLISQPLLMKYFKPQQPAPEQKPAVTQPAPAPAPAPAAAPAPAPSRKNARAAAPRTPATREASAEQQAVIENDLYKITFTNRGAQVKSWILKKYTDDHGKPLNLVNETAAAQHGYPLSLWTYDENLRKKLDGALYVVNTQDSSADGKPTRTVNFEYSDQDITVRKSFTFDMRRWDPKIPPGAEAAGYLVNVASSVTQNGQPVRAFPAWPAGFGDQSTPAAYASATIDLYKGGKTWHGSDQVIRNVVKKVSGGSTVNGPFAWAAAADQYFAAVFMPDNPKIAAMVELRNAIEIPKDPAKPEGDKIKEEVVGAAVGSLDGPSAERLFAGPKNLDVLQAIKAPALPGQQATNLEDLVDFGTYLGFIAKPLFLWLRWTYHHMVANWGWAIIILTVIINVVLFPLRLTSMKSALKMQKLQPQVTAIKKKYEKYSMRDPRKQEMNQEIAALFKREGANPMGGCIPMLIQFPFLVAFYSMLGSAIELRHAHFAWMTDLSSADPSHVLPILIIITTLAVQKMTPQAGMDPAQQKVMTLMMPVMLGVISWNLSSGLCLYWVVGNLVSIIQQYWMNNTRFGQEMRAEAEKRARKKGVPVKT